MCEAAVAVEKASGCPAEMLVAQCAVESNWLQSTPAWNCFGTKAYPNGYGRQLLLTREWLTQAEAADFASRLEGRTLTAMGPAMGDKRLYALHDWFATFPSLEACFARRAERWNAGRNLPWVKAYHATGELEPMLRAMAEGYATEPLYADSLLRVLAMPEVQAGLATARVAVEKQIAVSSVKLDGTRKA
jgi:flagellum-specific peptidoglycan hydrolase FlgJ